ncbi:MAG: phage/plasmid replication protein [Bacteroidota bacterium]
MYDNIDLRLSNESANADLLQVVTPMLVNASEHVFNDGESVSVCGTIDGLRVSVNKNNMKIKGNSICKWYLGDNFQTLTRGDTQRAIEKMSDLFHLPIDRSDMTRIDLAQNFTVKYDPSVYYRHLGNLQYFNRLEQGQGLYYNQSKKKQLVFYNKVAEYKAKGQPVPEMYQCTNTLRYEMRYRERLREVFNMPAVTAGDLYSEPFYVGILDRWHDAYKNINKIRNSISFDYTMVKTVRQFQQQAILFYVLNKGGQLEALREIEEAAKRGDISKKQKYDLKEQIETVCKSELLTSTSDVIEELNKKVKEAVKYYR